MKLSVKWLRELVDLPDDVDEICERMTMLGLEVEAVTPVNLAYPSVVVGDVREAIQHPNADRLRLCRVFDGAEEVSVVCGAPNVRAGLRVAFARVGAVLPRDFKIKKSKIRGEVSMGMICSEKELGLGRSHDGILELDGDPAPGTPVDEILGYSDTCIEIEVTPNRPDWLSHVGVARELAAHFGGEVRWPDAGPELEFGESDGEMRADIQDPVGCRRFLGRRIHGATVGVAPLWIRHRLIAIGQRSINSVVDVSNYVLHECGQPNHIFDRKKISGDAIVVRRAAKGEAFTTLDEVEREMDDHHLMIADQDKAIGLAGIMGGAQSEVDDTSTELVIEVAHFHPGVVRRGRRSLTMSTDASYRFERGIDHDLMPWVVRRITSLILESSGGEAVAQGFAARGEARPAPAQFRVRASQVGRVLGTALDASDIGDYLRRLEIPVEIEGDEVAVVQPSFRHDLLEEVDAVEEVARLYGFDRLDTPDRAPMLRPAERTPGEVLRRQIRDILAARGAHEVVATSFMPDQDPDRLRLATDDPRRQSLAVLNPVVQGEANLRTTALGEMLRIVDRNRRRGHHGPIRMFQLDRCFRSNPDSPLAVETETLTMIWNGPATPTHFLDGAEAVGPHDVMGEVDSFLGRLRLTVGRDPIDAEPYHRPGSGAVLRSGARVLGHLGEVHGEVRQAFDLEDPTFVLELDLSALEAARPTVAPYQPFSPFPAVRRDLSLVVPAAVPFGAIAERMDELLAPLLRNVEVFDLYQGEGLPEGCSAIGVRVELRSDQGTLKDGKVDALLAKLLDDLAQRYEIRLR